MVGKLAGNVELARTLPFYLVFDVSYSMSQVMPEVNGALTQLKDAVVANPLLADIARVSVISFADDGRVEIPMRDISEEQRIGSGEQILGARGSTSYAAAFKTLRTAIETDIAMLKSGGERAVFRPTVFFVTDGIPTDSDSDWQSAFNDLASMTQYPMLYPFGFGDAQEDVLRSITHPKTRSGGKAPAQYFTVRSGVSPAQAINKIVEVVVQSVVSCTTSATVGAPAHLIDTTGTEDVIVSHQMDVM